MFQHNLPVLVEWYATPSEVELGGWLESAEFLQAWQSRCVLKQDADRSVVVVNRGESQYLIKVYPASIYRRILEKINWRKSNVRLHRDLFAIRNDGVETPKTYGVCVVSSPIMGPYLMHVMEFLPAGEQLHNCLVAHIGEDFQFEGSLLSLALFELVKLHALGRYHGDAKLTNMLVAKNKVYLLDMVGRRVSSIEKYWVRDLARFLVGVAELGAPQVVLDEIVSRYSSAMNSKGCTLGKAFSEEVWKRARDKSIHHARRYGRQSVLYNGGDL